MKKKYEKPSIEDILMLTEDVISDTLPSKVPETDVIPGDSFWD